MVKLITKPTEKSGGSVLDYSNDDSQILGHSRDLLRAKDCGKKSVGALFSS
jgi:hypothetical protein